MSGQGDGFGWVDEMVGYLLGLSRSGVGVRVEVPSKSASLLGVFQHSLVEQAEHGDRYTAGVSPADVGAVIEFHRRELGGFDPWSGPGVAVPEGRKVEEPVCDCGKHEGGRHHSDCPVEVAKRRTLRAGDVVEGVGPTPRATVLDAAGVDGSIAVDLNGDALRAMNDELVRAQSDLMEAEKSRMVGSLRGDAGARGARKGGESVSGDAVAAAKREVHGRTGLEGVGEAVAVIEAEMSREASLLLAGMLRVEPYPDSPAATLVACARKLSRVLPVDRDGRVVLPGDELEYDDGERVSRIVATRAWGKHYKDRPEVRFGGAHESVMKLSQSSPAGDENKEGGG